MKDLSENNSVTAAESRRSFLKKSSLVAAGAAASQFPFVLTSHAAPDDPIRVGVIGCGGRGSGAVLDVLGAETKVIYPKSGYHTEDVQEGATHEEVLEMGRIGAERLVPLLGDLLPRLG